MNKRNKKLSKPKKTKDSSRLSKKRGKILAVIIIIVLLIPLTLFYGPFDQFRVMWINTAMNTSNHKFLAEFLYSREYIDKVLEDSRVSTEKKTAVGEVEVQGGEDITFAEIKGNYYRGYIIKVSDPARIDLIRANSEKGKLLEEIAAESGATGGINAGGYISDKTRGIEWGYCITGGAIQHDCSECKKHTLGGLDDKNRFIVGSFTPQEIEAQNYRWAVEFGPILIVNGEKTDITKFSGGIAPRTAIGQTQNGEILLLVIDGRQPSSIGATYADLQTVLYANGAVNALVLAGGASSSMMNEGVLVNSPSDGESERLLPNALMFK